MPIRAVPYVRKWRRLYRCKILRTCKCWISNLTDGLKHRSLVWCWRKNPVSSNPKEGIQCHSGDRIRPQNLSYNILFVLLLSLRVLQPFWHNNCIKFRSGYAKFLRWLRAKNICNYQHNMHLFSAEQKNALHRFQITPTDIAEFICQCIRSYAFSLRTLRHFPPRLKHECKHTDCLLVSSAWLTVWRASMVVPSGEGYWKQRYIDRERQLMTNELRRPLAAFKCLAVSFLVLAVDKDGHISKCDRWIYIYIPVSHQRLKTGSCR